MMCKIQKRQNRETLLSTNKRGAYSSQRQAARRSRILRAAGQHLERHGLEALSMASIAAVSEVSVKTLYNLFGSRDLLLLEAAAEVLVDIGQSKEIQAAEAGLPRLLAYVVTTMVNFNKMPAYARAVISTIVKADLEPHLADRHMGVVRRFAETSLQFAEDNGELRDDTDILQLAEHISANQWGAVLLWEKGLLKVEQLPTHVALSHYMTLLPLCIGTRKERMSAELEALIQDSGLATQYSR